MMKTHEDQQQKDNVYEHDPTTRLGELWRGQGLSRRTTAPLWLVLPTVLSLVELALTPQDSWDLWWHLAMGRVAATTGEVPSQILFLYTMDAQAFSFVQPWLSQRLLYELYEAGGGMGPLLLLRNLLTGAALFGVTWVGWRRAGAAWALVAPMMLATMFAISFIQVRTHLLAWPLFLLCLALAYRARAQEQTPRWLPVSFAAISALWVNLHGSFIIATLVALSFTASVIADKWRAPERASTRAMGMWIATTIGAALMTVCNPLGWRVYEYVVLMATSPVMLELSAERAPTTLSQPGDVGMWFWATYLGGLALLWHTRRRCRIEDVLMFVGFGLMTIRQCREMMWFGFALPLVLGPSLRAVLERLEPLKEPTQLQAQGARVLAALLVFGALCVQPWGAPQRELVARFGRVDARQEQPHRGVYLEDVPVEAIAPLRERLRQRPKLRIHHEQEYAGFLIYELQGGEPWPMVSLDQRIELPPASLYQELDVVNEGHGWREYFERYDVDAVVLRLSTQAELARQMEQDEGWEVLARGASWVALGRR
jgi:hypothetical protein